MRVKKFRNNRYLLAEGVWVRDPFCKSKAIDINLMGSHEINLFVSNETKNITSPHMQMDDMGELLAENVVIVSDGFEWESRQLVLGTLPSSKVKVFGVNGSLAKWSMVGESTNVKRTMTFYVVNNPYPECMSFLPKRHRYYPNLVSSTRTFPKFLENYSNQPYFYSPTTNINYAALGTSGTHMDDYRNPVCAAVSLAVRNGARKILLLCCDQAFKDGRPGSVKMANGLYQYPQQIMCQRIIDKQFFWLKQSGIKTGNCSYGIEYENAEYISHEGILDFFCSD
jgi:hypothetical protein